MREISILKQRILQYIEYKGITKYECYKNTGIANGVLSQANGLSEDNILKFLSYYTDINAEWLLTGKGPMLKEETIKGQEPELAESADLIRIPIVDISIAAGSGYMNPDYIEEVDNITLPSAMLKHRKTYLCVRVKGHSMTPSVLDGGYLIIRLLDRSEWESIQDNYVYVVTDREGKAFVKRLKNRLRLHGFIVCMSDNADKLNYPNFNIEEEDINSVWYAEWYFSAKIPNIQETYYRKQAELEDRMDELTKRFDQFQTALNIKQV